MKELEYTKNSKFEIEFTNLDEIKEGDNIVLKLKDGDLKILFQAIRQVDERINLYIPHFSDDILYIDIVSKFAQNFDVKIYALDNKSFFNDRHCDQDMLIHDKQIFYNTLPKWNIPEDNAVLFLSENDKERYVSYYESNIACFSLEDLETWALKYFNDKQEVQEITKISLVIPELHAENESCYYYIKNINKVCKELKEKYGVERIELFVSHCFINTKGCTTIFIEDFLDSSGINDISFMEGLCNVDKITTTNSTGILKVQETDRLKVIDVVEFFKD